MSLRVERIGPRGTRPTGDVRPVGALTPVVRRHPRDDDEETDREAPPRPEPAPAPPEDDGRPHVDVSA